MVNSRWLLRRARRQAARQRAALSLAGAAFLVLCLLLGTTVLGVRAANRWLGFASQNVHVIAFLRDDMESGKAELLLELLRRMPGVAAVHIVEPAEALAQLRTAAGPLAAGDALNGLEPGYFPRSLEVSLKPSSDLTRRAEALSNRLRLLPGVTEVDAMAGGASRLAAWLHLGRILAWIAVLAVAACAVALVLMAVAKGRALRRRLADVLSMLGETSWAIRFPASLGLASAALSGAVASLLILRLTWRPIAGLVERTLGVAQSVPPPFLRPLEIAGGLLGALCLGWLLGFLSTPLPRRTDA